MMKRAPDAPEKDLQDPPKGGAGATPRHLRYEAYPKGRPHSQDPKGGAGATPRHTALRRGEGGRWPTRRAAPSVKKVQGFHCCCHTRRLHACRCHTRRYPARHRHADTCRTRATLPLTLGRRCHAAAAAATPPSPRR